jgi:hypothetical protein
VSLPLLSCDDFDENNRVGDKLRGFEVEGWLGIDEDEDEDEDEDDETDDGGDER